MANYATFLYMIREPNNQWRNTMHVNTINYKELERFFVAFRRGLELLNKQAYSLSLSLEKMEKKRYELELGLTSRQKSEGLPANIIQLFKDKGDWLSPLQIRKAFAESTGRRLAQSTLRSCLVTNEGRLFQRDGKTRSTKWKLIDEPVQDT